MSYLMYENDVELFFENYKDVVLDYLSFYDTSEKSYHMFIYAMLLNFNDRFILSSNKEVGHGRADIILESKNLLKNPHYIIEIKYGKDLECKVQEGLQQIIDKKYTNSLKGKVICMSIAHNVKECLMAYKVIEK